MSSYGVMADDLREFPRALTRHERATLDFILSVDDDRLGPLREQATTATAVAGCQCPCASIDFAVDRARGNRSDQLPNFEITTAAVVNPDKNEVYFLSLFIRRGWLSLLDISYIDVVPEEFPPIDIWDPPQISEHAAYDPSASSTRTGAWSTSGMRSALRAWPSGS